MNIARSLKLITRQKIICLILTISILACSSVFAFADTSTEQFYYYQIGNGQHQLLGNKNSADMIGYVLAVLSYNQQQIYNKLSNISGGSSIDYTSLLTSINSNISTGLWAPINTGTDKLFYVGDTLSYINRPGWTNGEGLGQILTAYMSAMSYNIVSVYNELISVKSNTALLSNLPSILTTINDFKSANHTDITQVDTDLNAFKSANHIDITQVDTDLNAFKTANHTDITQVDTDLNAFKSANHTDIMQVDTDLNAFKSANHTDISSFNDDYNNIDWEDITYTWHGVKSSINGDYLTSNTTVNGNNGLYIDLSFDNSSNLYYLRVPIVIYNLVNDSDLKLDLSIVNSNNGNIYSLTDYIYYISTSANYTDIYFNVPVKFYYNSYHKLIHITANCNLRYLYNGVNDLKTISYNSKDYHDVANSIYLDNILELFRQAKFMFFDDESIAAKKANASQTTEVINGFTGSGSASASAGDFGDIKDSVGSVKSGLNTNVSISNILGIFNNNDGYGFWSDATRQELNSSTANRSNTKSAGASFTPLYDAKMRELYNAMGVKYE